MKLHITVNGKPDHKRMAMYAIQDKAVELYRKYAPKIDEFFVTQGKGYK
jgi:hypothetical protein